MRPEVAAHTPAHLSLLLSLIADALPESAHGQRWVLCCHLPEALEEDCRYLLLGGDPHVAEDGRIYPIAAPLRLNAWRARITQLMTQPAGNTPLASGWEFRIHARTLMHPQHAPLRLTEMECELLAFLHQHIGSVVTREDMLAHVFHYDRGAESHTVETHLYRLRQKLEDLNPAPCTIVTTDQGYRLSIL